MFVLNNYTMLVWSIFTFYEFAFSFQVFVACEVSKEQDLNSDMSF